MIVDDLEKIIDKSAVFDNGNYYFVEFEILGLYQNILLLTEAELEMFLRRLKKMLIWFVEKPGKISIPSIRYIEPIKREFYDAWSLKINRRSCLYDKIVGTRSLRVWFRRLLL